MTRRDCLTLATALVSSACGRQKTRGYSGYALVATSGENSLAVVDLQNFRLLKSIPLGAPPTAVVPAHTASGSYVLTPSTDSVHLIDGNLRVAVSRHFGGQLSEIRLSPDGRTLLAIASGSRELIVADPASLGVIRRIKLAAPPVDLDASENGYVAISGGPAGTVELLHLATGRRQRIHRAGALGAVRFRGDGRLLLVSDLEASSLLALDVPSLQVVAELPIAMRPDNLCFSADQGQLFVSGPGMDGIAIVFPYDVLKVDQTVLAGRDPGVMACSATPAYLFVASASGSDVCIMDIYPRKVIGLVEIGGRPSYIAITPGDQFALVLSENSNEMAVVHIPAVLASQSDPFKLRYRSGAALFTVVSVGSKPVHAAVLPRA
jgi:DNA-binding beta-propeller fold protein YncE